MSEKGFSSPILLIPLLILGLLFGAFWFLTNDVNVSSSSDDVRGTSTQTNHAKPGFSVSVISEDGSWDMVEYLCTTLEECTSSLESGVRWGTVSGGSTALHEVDVEASQDWNSYSHIKIFVRRGWSSAGGTFSVAEVGDLPDAEVYTLEKNGKPFESVVAPVESLVNNYHTGVIFTDQ